VAETTTWARVSIRVVGEHLTGADIATRLGRPNEAKTDRVWAVDVGDSSDPLADQLDRATQFLRDNQAVLSELAGEGEVNLHVSWTPRTPQDGLGLHPDLVGALAAVNGYVLIDTYIE
jgi:hypothetical protein